MKSFTSVLETDRLILRPFNLDDIESAYQMNLDPEVTKYTSDGGVQSKEEIYRRIIEDVLGDYKKYGYGRFAVVLKTTEEFIGFAGLKYIPEYDEVDIGYRFIRKYWGKGYATESALACLRFGLETLGLSKIVGLCLPQNIASVKVLKKLGFSYEKSFIEDGINIEQYCIINHKNIQG